MNFLRAFGLRVSSCGSGFGGVGVQMCRRLRFEGVGAYKV